MAVAADARRRARARSGSVGPRARSAALAATVCLRCEPQELRERAGAEDVTLAAHRLGVARRRPEAARRASTTSSLSIRRRAPQLDALALARHRVGLPARGMGAGGRARRALLGRASGSLRAALAEIYRALSAGELAGERLGAPCSAPARYPRSPEVGGALRAGPERDRRCRRGRAAETPAGSGSYPRRGPSWSDPAPGAPVRPTYQEGLRYLQSRRAERREVAGTERRRGPQRRRRPRARGRGRPARARATRAHPRRSQPPTAAPTAAPVDEFTRDLTDARARAARRPARGDRRARLDGDGHARSPRGRARLRVRLRAPRRPEAPLRRGVRQPPRRGGEDLRRPAARHRDALRRAAARHRRGHERQRSRRSRPGSARTSPTSSTASRS